MNLWFYSTAQFGSDYRKMRLFSKIVSKLIIICSINWKNLIGFINFFEVPWLPLILCVGFHNVVGFDQIQFFNVPKCPNIANGFYPLCDCKYGIKYDNVTNTCLNPVCPTDVATTGVFPHCKCTEKNYEYSSYLNECFRVCPQNSTGTCMVFFLNLILDLDNLLRSVKYDSFYKLIFSLCWTKKNQLFCHRKSVKYFKVNKCYES